MLSKGVDTAPDGNDQRVEEFLASSRPFQPELADQQQDGQEDTVGDEGAAHNEVCRTLAGMVSETESECCYASKNELYPDQDGHGLSNNTMRQHNPSSYLSMYAFLHVKFQVYSHDNLADEGQHHDRDELGVHVRRKLAAFMLVSKEVSHYGEHGAGRLYGDVPF
jgi:hypothetical protein